MAKRNDVVPRPLRKSEYRIEFATSEAASGWRDLCNRRRNAAVEAWDILTTHPMDENENLYALKGDLRLIEYNGQDFIRFQYKVNYSERIWYYVMPDMTGKNQGVVRLERVSAKHPKETE